MSNIVRKSSTYLLMLTLVPAGYAAAATMKTSVESPKELSVAPLDHIEYPESRPKWVSDLAESDGESFRAVIVSGPCDTVEESLEELRLMQRAAVSTLVTQIAQSDGRFDFYAPSDEEIERDLVIRQYAGEVTQGDQNRYEHAVEIEFSKAQQRAVRQAWQNVEIRHRLGAAGVVTFTSLVLLICGSAVTGMFSRRAQRRERHVALAQEQERLAAARLLHLERGRATLRLRLFQ